MLHPNIWFAPFRNHQSLLVPTRSNPNRLLQDVCRLPKYFGQSCPVNALMQWLPRPAQASLVRIHLYRCYMAAPLPRKTNTYTTILRKATTCNVCSRTNKILIRFLPLKAKGIYPPSLNRRTIKKAALHVWVRDQCIQARITLKTCMRSNRHEEERYKIIYLTLYPNLYRSDFGHY